MTTEEDSNEERCRAMGKANLGKVASDETREKMSQVRKGKPHSKEHSENIGKALKGRVITPEWREKLRQAALGRKMSEGAKKKMSDSKKGQKNHFYGKKHSEETKDRISDSRIVNGVACLDKNPAWKGGLSFEPYCPKFNEDLRRRVRAFFSDTCQMCGHVHQPGEKKMAVHHVNFRKDSCCTADVIPLFVTVCPGEKGSPSCHAKTNHNRGYWETCFTQLINNKYGGKCYVPKGSL